MELKTWTYEWEFEGKRGAFSFEATEAHAWADHIASFMAADRSGSAFGKAGYKLVEKYP